MSEKQVGIHYKCMFVATAGYKVNYRMSWGNGGVKVSRPHSQSKGVYHASYMYIPTKLSLTV